MKRLLNWFRRTLQTRPATVPRKRSIRPQLEQLDYRIVLNRGSSASSAISIWHWGGGNSWTERDWFALDLSTSQVVEFAGTSRYNLGGPMTTLIRAAVDPRTGFAEVFVISGNSPTGSLWLCDSLGTWHNFGGNYKGIDATRDGHVYVVTADGSDVRYVDSFGNATDLGAPNTGNGPYASYSLAASISSFGSNEVFVIGADGAIYVNTTNAAGQWQLVDNSQQFRYLSAAQDNVVFALAGSKLYQETEYWFRFNGHWFSYWNSLDISGGMQFIGGISVDSDASGGDEVYAITSNLNAYRYDQGHWAWLDSGCSDICGADSGYFYDVHFDNENRDGWQYNPNGSWYVPYWTYLGSNLG
jgi:hypothetical protein